MAGRKKIPTALNVIRGNPGKRALPKDEPIIKAEKPRAPVTLSPVAKKHWGVIVKQLYDSKIMTRIDSDALAIYCEAYAVWVDATEKMRGDMITYNEKGFPSLNPYFRVSVQAADQMRRLLCEFGMTPASRTKVAAVGGKAKEADPWSDL